MKPDVLLIDDDPSFCLAMSKALRRRGFHVDVVQESDAALTALQRATADTVAVIDLRMPKRSGLELLQRSEGRRAATLMLTGHGAVPEAVAAIKAGAYTFLTKPIDAVDLEPMILSAHRDLRRRMPAPVAFVGESPVAHTIRSLISRLATTNAPILITGETGTGKEVVARSIHSMSAHPDARFVPINVSTLSQSAFEEELFGSVATSSSAGASSAERGEVKRGLLDEVGQGTLFFDEVDALTLEHQAKLLRLVEGGEYRRVGSSELKRFAGRVIASTHHDLSLEVNARRFRSDLFHRLSVYPIDLPPLIERERDAIEILRYWFERITERALKIDADSLDLLAAHDWPGNAREVVNLARRISILSDPRSLALPAIDETTLTAAELAALLNHQLFVRQDNLSVSRSQVASHHADRSDQVQSARSDKQLIGGDHSLEYIEREHISQLIERHGNLTQVARILNVNRRTLQRKLKQWSE